MSVLLIVITIAQHVAGGGNGYARYLFPVLGVLATFVVLGLDRLVPRVLPAVVVVMLAWWAIANIPTAVDPHRVRRPRDRGAPAPLALQVLPGNDALRLLIAVVIGVSTVLAVAAVVVGAVRRRHRRGVTSGWLALEAAFFAERGVEVAVVGWTLTALLSTRIAGIPLVAEHAGSFVPPLLERGLLPGVDPSLVDLDLYTGGFNRVAAELGVEGVPSFPALLLGDLTLVTEVPEVLGITAAEIESWVPTPTGRYRPGTRMRCTGPLFAHLDAPVPDDVEAFLDSPGPVIYVAITSSPPDLVRHVVANLAPLGARVLVAATVHDLGDLAGPDVCVAGVLPSHEVMPRVDLAVTAGGQGSVQTAIASGCPFVGIPLQPEQHSNVAIVEGHGAARLVPLDQAGGSALTDAARQLLGDPNARAQARRLQQLYAAVDGPGAAADAIAELLSATAEARR